MYKAVQEIFRYVEYFHYLFCIKYIGIFIKHVIILQKIYLLSCYWFLKIYSGLYGIEIYTIQMNHKVNQKRKEQNDGNKIYMQ